MLTVQSVCKRIEDNNKIVFCEISLDVHPHEFVSIVGPSGCGKTELLEVCAGLKNFHHGLCMLNGEPVTHPGLSAYIPRGDSLFYWRRLNSNISLALEKEMPREEAMKKAEELLHQCRMHHLAESWPAELSEVEKRQAALLRAILSDKDLLLLDNPFALLDGLSRKDIQIWLKKLIKKKNQAALMGTEDIDEAVFLSHRVYVMRHEKPLKEIKINIDNQDRNSTDFRKKCKEIEESLLE